jgi:hypothetical protein
MVSPYEPPQYAQPQQAYVDSRRKKLKLKRVGVLSSGIFGAVAGAIFGLIAGLFAAVLGAFAGAGAGARVLGSAVAFLLVAPIMYGFGGFLGGLLNAAVYNVVAGLTGGIEMEFGDD